MGGGSQGCFFFLHYNVGSLLGPSFFFFGWGGLLIDYFNLFVCIL